MLSDTGDQVVCTVGQAYGHSSPRHITSRAGVQWDRIGPQATPLMPLRARGPTPAKILYEISKSQISE